MPESTFESVLKRQYEVVGQMQEQVLSHKEEPALAREYSICLQQAADKLATLLSVEHLVQ
jgi:hypothetical protein